MAVGGVLVVGVADANLPEVGIQDVGLVSLRPHPALHHTCRGAEAGGDVLPAGSHLVATIGDALPGAGVVQAAVVGEAVVGGHVLAVAASGTPQLV